MKFLSFYLLLFASLTFSFSIKADWRLLKEGIHYRTVEKSFQSTAVRNVKLHAFKIEQERFALSIRSFHDIKDSQNINISSLRKREESMLVVSGGFFDPDFRKPVGLVIEDGIVVSELTKKFSGVIWIKNDRLHLSSTESFNLNNQQPEYAIQGYPRIVDPVNRLGIKKQQTIFAHRAAVCTIKGAFIILISDKNFDGLSLFEFAQIAQGSVEQDGFACDIAVNLDGGPAPGISVSPELLDLNIQEGWQVPNVLVVSNKSASKE